MCIGGGDPNATNSTLLRPMTFSSIQYWNPGNDRPFSEYKTGLGLEHATIENTIYGTLSSDLIRGLEPIDGRYGPSHNRQRFILDPDSNSFYQGTPILGTVKSNFFVLPKFELPVTEFSNYLSGRNGDDTIYASQNG